MSLWNLNTPPNWHKNAVATPAGWADPITGELLVSIVGLSTTKEPSDVCSLVSVYFDKLAYGHGSTAHVIAQFSAPVTVTGTPHLTISLNGSNHTLSYASGSGTAFLTFPYTVGGSDVSLAGQTGISSPIALNGGTIHDTNTGNSPVLSFTAASSTPNVVIDAVLPTITGITAPASTTIVTGNAIPFSVAFSKAVTVVGTPTLTVNFADSSTSGTATYQSGTGTSTLVYSYTVSSLDQAALGNVTVSSPILTPNSSIVDEVGNPATLTHSATFPLLAINDVGAIVGVSLAAADYVTGNVLPLYVNFDQVVLVTGTPTLPLSINSVSRTASYVSGTGTNSLLFNYTVVSGDSANYSQFVTGTTLSGGTITDVAGTGVGYTFSQVSFTTSTVNIAHIVSVSAPASANYATAAVLSFTAAFTDNVTVTGTPQLAVTIGSNVRQAAYASGSGTKNLVFSYTLLSGDAATAGNVTVGTLGLNGGTIKNASAVNAILTFTAPTTSGIVVNDPAPTVSSVTVASGNYTTLSGAASTQLPVVVTFNKPVVVTGSPQVALTINSLTRQAVYSTGSGTTQLTFVYPVVTADTGAVTIGSNALALNSGTIMDVLQTVATLTFSSPTLTNVITNDVPMTLGAAAFSTTGTVPHLVTGNTFVLTLTTSKTATVTGTPLIDVSLPTGQVSAAYASGSGSTSLVFSYTLQSTDSAAVGEVVVIDQVVLNAGTIVDSLGIAPSSYAFTAPSTGTLLVN